MATSNRDRVQQGFALLAEGLLPFVGQHMSEATPAGHDWLEVRRVEGPEPQRPAGPAPSGDRGVAGL